jgi:hypothetical protein
MADKNPSARHREEVINTHLAILLARHGVDADAETIHHAGKEKPDVMFSMSGMRGAWLPPAENSKTQTLLHQAQAGFFWLNA